MGSFPNAEAERAYFAEAAIFLVNSFPRDFRVCPRDQVVKYCSTNAVAAEYVDPRANEVAQWVYDGLAPFQQHLTYENYEDVSAATSSPTGKSPYFNLWMQPVHSSHWFVICARICV